MSKHHFGPLTASDYVTMTSGEPESGACVMLGEDTVCDIQYALWPKDQADALARLFAAAPETAAERDRLKEINADLLAALETLMIGCDCAGHSSGIQWALEQGRAAIRKARGEA